MDWSWAERPAWCHKALDVVVGGEALLWRSAIHTIRGAVGGSHDVYILETSVGGRSSSTAIVQNQLQRYFSTPLSSK